MPTPDPRPANGAQPAPFGERLHGLTAPAYLVALALLLLNDRVWKAADPSVWTGKLSDVAGLVVLPVLLCALAGVRSRRGAWAVHGAVGALFAAMQFVSLDGPLGAFRAATGIALAHVPDAADLVALAVLPLGVWLVHRPPARWAGRAVRTGVLALSVVAVAGTSRPPEPPLLGPQALGRAPTAEAAFAAVDAALHAQDMLVMVDSLAVADTTDGRVRRFYSVSFEHRPAPDSMHTVSGWLSIAWDPPTEGVFLEDDVFEIPGLGVPDRRALTAVVEARIAAPLRAALEP